MAKAQRQAPAPDAEIEEQIIPHNAQLEFELWDVNVEYKKRQDPETFQIVTEAEISKKGDKPVRTVTIEQRHADILNEQSANTKQRYYLKP